MEISPENWKTVKSLFEAALDLNPAEIPDFLEKNCEDLHVRAEVERLLREHRSPEDFLSMPLGRSFHSISDVNCTRFKSGELVAHRFKIINFIGAGGMGEVYEAEDIELRENVAIKTIRPEMLRQPTAVERLRREVRIARKVTHPNVCRINDLFWHRPQGDAGDDGAVLISMELLRGTTLTENLEGCGRMTTEAALPLVRQIVSGLGAAHHAGIVHRDFKPGNIMLVPSGSGAELRAVVTDFGLARQPASLDTAAHSTLSGELWGSPAYMAPEQIEGHSASVASDIYALGLVMYEMVTGRRPVDGDTPISAAAKRLLIAAPSPLRLCPELSGQWEAVILRCLERDPSKRFANVHEVADALCSQKPGLVKTRKLPFIRSARELFGTQATRNRRSLELPLLAALSAVVFVGLIIYARVRQSEPPSEKDHPARELGNQAPAEATNTGARVPLGNEPASSPQIKKPVTSVSSETTIVSNLNKTLAVLSTQPWTDTEIDLEIGQTVSVNATGTMRFSAEIPSVGPYGDQSSCLLNPNPRVPYIAPKLRCHSLIAKIGPSGSAFEVGASQLFETWSAGRLYLGVNDNFFPDNSGTWTAQVSAEKRGTHAVTWQYQCTSGGVAGVRDKPPGTVRIESGTGTFSKISTTNKVVLISPGAEMLGTAKLTALNQGPGFAIAPLMLTPSWGDHQNSWKTIANLQPGPSTVDAQIDERAPSQPGTYYLIFAFQLEKEGGNVASGTSWTQPSNVWNNGNDIADFRLSQVREAQEFGCTVNRWLTEDGIGFLYLPADVITVSVSSN